jgi:hypothetical protein
MTYHAAIDGHCLVPLQFQLSASTIISRQTNSSLHHHSAHFFRANRLNSLGSATHLTIFDSTTIRVDMSAANTTQWLLSFTAFFLIIAPALHFVYKYRLAYRYCELVGIDT